MQTGNRYRCYPTPEQEIILLRWIGCQRFIYNAKVSEDRYYRAFVRRFVENAGQHAPMDQEYSRFIGTDTAWLRQVPSQILRNGAVRWRQGYARFFSKLGGRPKIHKRCGPQSVWLTSELFSFGEDGALWIGTKKFPFGELAYRRHREHGAPSSIHITVDAGRWWLSFSTDDGEPECGEQDIAAWLAQFDRDELAAQTVGVDRGVAIPLAVSNGQDFDFLPIHKKRFRKRQKQRRRWQRATARRTKASKRRDKAKVRAARQLRYSKDVRRDFAHKASHAIANDPRVSLIVWEDLKIKNMTRSAKGTSDAPGKRVRQKAGLNRAILASAWSQAKTYTAYKALRLHKLSIVVPPHRTSQECSICGCIHPDNRQSQNRFVCQDCGSIENADRNASRNIKRRGVDLILSGEWSPKERKRANIRKEGTAGMAGTGSNPNARGEHVSRSARKVAAQRSANREAPATASA